MNSDGSLRTIEEGSQPSARRKRAFSKVKTALLGSDRDRGGPQTAPGAGDVPGEAVGQERKGPGGAIKSMLGLRRGRHRSAAALPVVEPPSATSSLHPTLAPQVATASGYKRPYSRSAPPPTPSSINTAVSYVGAGPASSITVLSSAISSHAPASTESTSPCSIPSPLSYTTYTPTTPGGLSSINPSTMSDAQQQQPNQQQQQQPPPQGLPRTILPRTPSIRRRSNSPRAPPGHRAATEEEAHEREREWRVLQASLLSPPTGKYDPITTLVEEEALAAAPGQLPLSATGFAAAATAAAAAEGGDPIHRPGSTTTSVSVSATRRKSQAQREVPGGAAAAGGPRWMYGEEWSLDKGLCAGTPGGSAAGRPWAGMGGLRRQGSGPALQQSLGVRVMEGVRRGSTTTLESGREDVGPLTFAMDG
ncbi:hypothetical protein HK101_002228, partial [Irineochytrium annulatum]